MSECSSELWRKRDGWDKPSRTLYDRQTGTSSRRTDVRKSRFHTHRRVGGKGGRAARSLRLYFQLEVDRDVDPL